MTVRRCRPWLTLLGLACVCPAALAQPCELPPRIQKIVLHVLGSPDYDHPDQRFIFFDPLKTQALWKPTFGTHWIVWVDGSLWPRHARPDEPPSLVPPAGQPADEAWRCRIAADAAPVYSHVHKANSDTVGIEVAHSGRCEDPFPAAQVASLRWLLQTLLELSHGRLTPAAIVGHKDLDQRPAYVRWRCSQPGCRVYVDAQGQPFKRRVDPPESLFLALEAAGLAIPRPVGDNDADLARAEIQKPARRPRIGRL